jgi:RNA polymerase-binding transcription factor DksA
MTAPSAPTPLFAADDLTPLRLTLLEELEAQHAQLRELQTTIDELTGGVDGGSSAEREIAERAHRRTLETIADVELALGRMDAGTYGTCERCGGPIALVRLEAIPFTRHCVDCPPPTTPLVG